MRNAKFKFTKTVISLLMAGALLGACANNESGSRQVGTVVGGVLGAILGSKLGEGSGRTVSIALGAGLGALLGNEVGRRLSKLDHKMANANLNKTLESSESDEGSSWSNPKTGNTGTATAGEPYEQASNGRDCRDFETTVYTEDGEHIANGTACRNDDGSWEVVREPSA